MDRTVTILLLLLVANIGLGDSTNEAHSNENRSSEKKGTEEASVHSQREQTVHAALLRDNSNRDIPRDDEIENEEFDKFIKTHLSRPTIETVFVKTDAVNHSKEDDKLLNKNSSHLNTQAEVFKKSAALTAFERSIALPHIDLANDFSGYTNDHTGLVHIDGADGHQNFNILQPIVPHTLPVHSPGTDINIPHTAVKTKTYQIRRPAVQKHFYDIEERFLIRPAGTLVVEYDRPVAKIPTGERIVPIGAVFGGGVNGRPGYANQYPFTIENGVSSVIPQSQNAIGASPGGGRYGGPAYLPPVNSVPNIFVRQPQGGNVGVGPNQDQGVVGISQSGPQGGFIIQGTQQSFGQGGSPSDGTISILQSSTPAGVFPIGTGIQPSYRGFRYFEGASGPSFVGSPSQPGGVSTAGIQQPQGSLGISGAGGGLGIQQGQGVIGTSQGVTGTTIAGGIQQSQGALGVLGNGVGVGLQQGQSGIGVPSPGIGASTIGVQQPQGGLGVSGGGAGLGIQSNQGSLGASQPGYENGISIYGIQQPQNTFRGSDFGPSLGPNRIGVSQFGTGGGQSQGTLDSGRGILIQRQPGFIGIYQPGSGGSDVSATEPQGIFGAVGRGISNGGVQQSQSGLGTSDNGAGVGILQSQSGIGVAGGGSGVGIQQSQGGFGVASGGSGIGFQQSQGGSDVGVGIQQSQSGIGVAGVGSGIGIQQSQTGIGVTGGGSGIGIQQPRGGFGVAGRGSGIGIQQSQGGFGVTSGGSGVGVGVQQSQGRFGVAGVGSGIGIQQPQGGFGVAGGGSGIGNQQSQGGFGVTSGGSGVGVGVQQSQGGFGVTSGGSGVGIGNQQSQGGFGVTSGGSGVGVGVQQSQSGIGVAGRGTDVGIQQSQGGFGVTSGGSGVGDGNQQSQGGFGVTRGGSGVGVGVQQSQGDFGVTSGGSGVGVGVQQSQGSFGVTSGGSGVGVGIQQSQGGFGVTSGGSGVGVGVQQSQGGFGVTSGGSGGGVGIQQSQGGFGVASGGSGVGVGIQQSQGGFGVTSGGSGVGVGIQQSQSGIGGGSGVGIQQSQSGIAFTTTPSSVISPSTGNNQINIGGGIPNGIYSTTLKPIQSTNIGTGLVLEGRSNTNVQNKKSFSSTTTTEQSFSQSSSQDAAAFAVAASTENSGAGGGQYTTGKPYVEINPHGSPLGHLRQLPLMSQPYARLRHQDLIVDNYDNGDVNCNVSKPHLPHRGRDEVYFVEVPVTTVHTAKTADYVRDQHQTGQQSQDRQQVGNFGQSIQDSQISRTPIQRFHSVNQGSTIPTTENPPDTLEFTRKPLVHHGYQSDRYVQDRPTHIRQDDQEGNEGVYIHKTNQIHFDKHPIQQEDTSHKEIGQNPRTLPTAHTIYRFHPLTLKYVRENTENAKDIQDRKDQHRNLNPEINRTSKYVNSEIIYDKKGNLDVPEESAESSTHRAFILTQTEKIPDSKEENQDHNSENILFKSPLKVIYASASPPVLNANSRYTLQENPEGLRGSYLDNVNDHHQTSDTLTNNGRLLHSDYDTNDSQSHIQHKDLENVLLKSPARIVYVSTSPRDDLKHSRYTEESTDQGTNYDRIGQIKVEHTPNQATGEQPTYLSRSTTDAESHFLHRGHENVPLRGAVSVVYGSVTPNELSGKTHSTIESNNKETDRVDSNLNRDSPKIVYSSSNKGLQLATDSEPHILHSGNKNVLLKGPARIIYVSSTSPSISSRYTLEENDQRENYPQYVSRGSVNENHFSNFARSGIVYPSSTSSPDLSRYVLEEKRQKPQQAYVETTNLHHYSPLTPPSSVNEDQSSDSDRLGVTYVLSTSPPLNTKPILEIRNQKADHSHVGDSNLDNNSQTSYNNPSYKGRQRATDSEVQSLHTSYRNALFKGPAGIVYASPTSSSLPSHYTLEDKHQEDAHVKEEHLFQPGEYIPHGSLNERSSTSPPFLSRYTLEDKRQKSEQGYFKTADLHPNSPLTPHSLVNEKYSSQSVRPGVVHVSSASPPFSSRYILDDQPENTHVDEVNLHHYPQHIPHIEDQASDFSPPRSSTDANNGQQDRDCISAKIVHGVNYASSQTPSRQDFSDHSQYRLETKPEDAVGYTQSNIDQPTQHFKQHAANQEHPLGHSVSRIQLSPSLRLQHTRGNLQKYHNKQPNGAITLRSGLSYGDQKVIASTPSSKDNGAASESIQTRRIVVNHPFQTVQEVVEHEPVSDFQQLSIGQQGRLNDGSTTRTGGSGSNLSTADTTDN